jgi:hypothetical protein
MSGSGEAAGGGGALASATGTAEGASELKGIGPDDAEFGMGEHRGVDYTTMSGADFQRAVGVDPVKWAAAFLQCYAKADGVRTDGHRELYVAGWFRDAMDAARKDT